MFIYNRSYQVVVMKINKTTLIKRSTSSYTVFKSNLDAGYNEPYITAEFNTSMFKKLKTFVIGKINFFCNYMANMYYNDMANATFCSIF